MPEFKLPQFSADMSKEELLEAVAKQNKTLTWLIQNLDDMNILDLDGNKLFPVSVQDGKIVDLAGNKLWDLTVNGGSKLVDISTPNSKISDLDGAKLFLDSVLNDVLVSMDGAKLFALSTPYGNLRNTRQSGYIEIGIPAGVPPSYTVYPSSGLITHSQILANTTSPMIRAGISDAYAHPIEYWSFPGWNNGVSFKILTETENGFNILIQNNTGAAQLIPLYWYRDGIY